LNILFAGKQKVTGSWKLAFEKAFVLFNIGHAYSEMASQQSLSTDEK